MLESSTTNPEEHHQFPERPKTTVSSTKITRKIINSAIYVEKPLSTHASSENCSIMTSRQSEELLEINTKRCTCSVDETSCPCHEKMYLNCESREETVTPKVTPKLLETKSKISQCSDNSSTDSKNHVIKKWITKKDEHKKKKEMETKLSLEAKKKEREALLEQERANFAKWLMNKKRMEKEAQEKKKKKELEEQQLKELEREKRQLENELHFQLWLKKKEEEDIEKKIQKQIEIITDLGRKESQVRDNEKAFNEWLKNSRNRPKPIPLNRGLQCSTKDCSTKNNTVISALNASTSVTYMNPNPWKSLV